MTDSYGIPIFEGDVIYQEYWLENMKLDMWHFVCWDEKLGCFIARCCNQDGVAEYDDPYDRNGYAPMLREWVEEKTVIGNIHCHNTSKDGCTTNSIKVFLFGAILRLRVNGASNCEKKNSHPIT